MATTSTMFGSSSTTSTRCGSVVLIWVSMREVPWRLLGALAQGLRRAGAVVQRSVRHAGAALPHGRHDRGRAGPPVLWHAHAAAVGDDPADAAVLHRVREPGHRHVALAPGEAA